jgi:hypothetical protein
MTGWEALVDVLSKAMAGMPCTNRETAAEKAAAHKWMEKERARLRPRNLRTLRKLKEETARLKAKGMI